MTSSVKWGYNNAYTYGPHGEIVRIKDSQLEALSDTTLYANELAKFFFLPLALELAPFHSSYRRPSLSQLSPHTWITDTDF